MTIISSINYRESFFEYHDLTKILGVPTYNTLHQLQLEIRANALTVHSNLGGGQHGHLSLVTSPTAYALVSNTPYVTPVHQGTLNVPATATKHAQHFLERAHDEDLRVFHEVCGIERALFQQLVDSVEAQYLTAMKNRITGQFRGTLYELLRYLILTYGKITTSQLIQLEQDTKDFAYDPVAPIDVVFNQAEDLLEFGEMATNPFSAMQTINMAYNIINKTRKFKDAIKSWNRRPANKRNWVNFKAHFRAAHSELQETGEVTMEAAGYHQANLVENIVTCMAHLYPPPQEPVYQTQPSPAMAPTPVANAVTDRLQQQMLAQMQQMQQMILALQQQQTTSTTASTEHNNQPRRVRTNSRPPPTGPRTGQPSNPIPAWATKYCWTHGKCSHAGADCRAKAPGHQDNASITNSMSGSTYGCN